MQDKNGMWAQITARLKESLSDGDFYAFEQTFWLVKAQGNTFVFGYNDKYVYRDFTGRNLNALRAALSGFSDRLPDIKFKYDKKGRPFFAGSFSDVGFKGGWQNNMQSDGPNGLPSQNGGLQGGREPCGMPFSEQRERQDGEQDKAACEQEKKVQGFRDESVEKAEKPAFDETDFKSGAKRQKKNYKKGFKNIFASFVCLVLALVLAVVGVNYIANRSFKENFYSLSLRNTYDNFRIIQLSDLHNTSFGKSNDKLLSRIEKLRPDIIVLTGDCLDSDGDINEITVLCKALADIAPTYYIYGNNEWKRAFDFGSTLNDIDGFLNSDDSNRDPERLYAADNGLKKTIEATGVKVLFNSSDIIEIGSNRVKIFGTLTSNPSAFWPYAGNEFYKFISEDDNCVRLLLCHEPLLFETLYEEYWGDLVLCGDTHGGVVRLPSFGAVYSRNFGFLPERNNHLIYGKYKAGNSDVIVSSGLTNKGVPRIFNQPELVVVDANKY